MKNEIILWDQSKCETCYSCIRACPVKAIHVKGESVFPCIESACCNHCGQCISACAYGALSYYNSVKDVKRLLNSEYKVAAICAPSIAGEFTDITDYRKFVQMIRYLGFDYVHEMSFGVDVVAAKYRDLVSPFKGKYYLTSHCPAVVELIEKKFPEQVENLAPILPPNAATAVVIRNIHGSKIRVVHITACVAAKATINRYQGDAKIDAVLTFKELRDLFEEFKIKEAYTEFSDFDPPYGFKGGLYPIPRGFIEAANLDISLLNSVSQTVDGHRKVMNAVQQFSTLTETIKSHFNLLLCEGCISGPGMSGRKNKFLKRTLTKDYVRKRLAGFSETEWERALDKHAENPALTATFKATPFQLPEVDEAVVKEHLQQITEPKNGIQLNCGACGYATCRGLAVAVAQKIAIPEMCVPNSRLGSIVAHHVIKKKDEEIQKAKEQLSQYEIDTQIAQNQISSLTSALSILIKNLNAGLVLVNEKLKVIDANMGFINIMGDDAVEIHEIIPYLVGADINSLLPPDIASQLAYFVQHNERQISKDAEIEEKLVNITLFQMIPNQMVGVLIRNLHATEERPEEIISRIEAVIEENLRQVQQMGFILGEGAAKTEKMLNTIIQTYK